MKSTMMAAVLVFLLGGQTAQAQIATSVEVFALGVDGDQAMVTPDYFARMGDVSVYGFAEFVGDGSWFTNHSATWSFTKHFGLYGEVGLTDDDIFSSAIGPSISIPAPGFIYLKVRPTVVLGDHERTRELNIVWKTESLPVFGGEIWTEGFIRTLRDAGNTYGQPQLWWRKTDSSWHFGIEVEVAGADQTLRGGLRKTF